jgi:uncharacterized membrane protein YqaE (UPF0057 family)
MIDKLFSAIVTIGEVSVTLGEMLVFLVKAITELLQAALLILNPIKIVNDSITGIFMAVKIVVVNILSFFTSAKRKTYNACKSAGEGLFGYRRPRNSEGKLISSKGVRGSKCMRPKLLVLITTVLCPPLGLFFHIGSSGWFHIIIATVLTVYTYYFPGLIYTLLHILC